MFQSNWLSGILTGSFHSVSRGVISSATTFCFDADEAQIEEAFHRSIQTFRSRVLCSAELNVNEYIIHVGIHHTCVCISWVDIDGFCLHADGRLRGACENKYSYLCALVHSCCLSASQYRSFWKLDHSGNWRKVIPGHLNDAECNPLSLQAYRVHLTHVWYLDLSFHSLGYIQIQSPSWFYGGVLYFPPL